MRCPSKINLEAYFLEKKDSLSLAFHIQDCSSCTHALEEMEKEGKPANIGDALGKFMSGDNPAKLMELVGKFGSKLQQEVQRGSINPEELLQQTMGALGGGGDSVGMANMMQQMAKNPQVRQAARKQAIRDRIRAKLDAKKAQQPPQ